MTPTVLTESPTLLLHPGAPQNPTAANVIQIDFRLNDGTAGVLVPLFIGTEPAERFRVSLGEQGRGMTLLQLAGFDALEGMLADLKKGGATHVNFNAERDRPNPIPIDEVIDSLRNRPKP